MSNLTFTISIPDDHEDQCIEWLLAHLANRGYKCLGVQVNKESEDV